MVGPELRAQKRQRREAAFAIMAAEIFAEWAQGGPAFLEAAEKPSQAYQELTQGLKAKIRQSSYAPALKIALTRELAQVSQDWLDTHDIAGQAIEMPTRIGRIAVRRSEVGFTPLIACRNAEEAFFKELKGLAKSSRNEAPDWIALALWSAATRGSLLEPTLLRGLADQLALGKVDFYSARCGAPIESQREPIRRPQRLYVRITAAQGSLNSGPYNQRNADHLERIHYWQPDPLTLTLINRILERLSTGPVATDAINASLVSLLRVSPFTNQRNPLPHLARLALWASDDRPELEYSEAILSAISGQWRGAGLDDQAMFCLYGSASMPKGSVKKVSFNDKERRIKKYSSSIFEALDKIISNSRRHKNEALLKRELSVLAASSQGTSVGILLAIWLSQVADRDRTVSTIGTYFSRIGHRLWEEFGDEELADLDADELSERYETLAGQIEGREARNRVGQVLDMFHGYAASLDKDIEDLDQQVWEYSTARVIRARFVPIWLFQKALAILPLITSPDKARAVRWAMVLAYRAGLRRTEVCKIRPIDIEFSEDLWLFLTSNRFGEQKTGNANRMIRLATVLTDSEKHHVAKDATQCRDEGRPIIWQLARSEMAAAEVGAIANAALRHALGSDDWTFHHLRHSAANAFFLVATEESGLCEEWFGWKRNRQRAILEHFTPHEKWRQARFMGLGALMGHASADQSFSSYIHLVADVAAERWRRLDIPKSDRAMIKLINRKLGEDRRLSGPALGSIPVFEKALAHFVTPLGQGKTHNAVSKAVNLPKSEVWRIRPEDVALLIAGRIYDALDDINRGIAPEIAAERSDIPLDYLQLVLARARENASAMTTRGSPRLQLSPSFSEFGAFLPPKPYHKSGRIDAPTLLAMFLKHGQQAKGAAELQWLVHYSLTEATASNPGIYFSKVAEMTKFIGILTAMGFTTDRLHVNFELPRKEDVALWLKALPDLTYTIRPGRKPKSNAAQGRAILIVGSPASKRQNASSTSIVKMSEGWRFAISMVSICEGWKPDAYSYIGKLLTSPTRA